jgi:hypothetical protein
VQARLKGRLGARRLDRHVDSTPIGQAQDPATGSTLRKSTTWSAPRRFVISIRAGTLSTAMMGRGAHQPRSYGGAEADRPLCEDCDRVSDADLATFGTGETGGHDVGTHQHLLVGQAVGNRS